MTTTRPADGPVAHDTEVDILVVGSGTGLAAALSAHERGASVLVVEKTEVVGGSTARSGGAFWVPDNPVLTAAGRPRDPEAAETYLDAVVGDSAPKPRRDAFRTAGPDAVAMLERTTPLTFCWDEGYADYHPEEPGGSAAGRTCESEPFDVAVLGPERSRLRPGPMKAAVPMPVTGKDYRWMNLMARVPHKAVPRIVRRLAQGVGGKVIGREYVAGGQALVAGMFAGLISAGVPVWTRAGVVDLITDGGRVTGAVVEQDGRRVTVTARRGVILATGGFDHDIARRREVQSPSLVEGHSFGAEGNVGDGQRLGRQLGADVALLDQAWWFPAGAPLPGGAPQVLLAERSLPGSLIVDQTGRRFTNESRDYMSFGQEVLRLRAEEGRAETMWLVMDQENRNSYVLAAAVFPRMALPQAWLDAGIAATAASPEELARAIGIDPGVFAQTVRTFNAGAARGVDEEFGRGASAYDRYYGDPTVTPNPNLRPLSGTLYALKVVLADLGTCGGLVADERGRVLRADGSAIEGLYALGNVAANAFGHSYPGAGATIGQGIVYGHIIARELTDGRS